MTQREYLRVLGPFVLTTMTQPLLGAVDTAVMGRLPDPAYIAGVAVGAVIFNTVYWLLGFLRVGSTGFSAQAGDDPEQLRKAVLLPGLMALGLSLLILLLQHPIFAGAMLVLEPDEATRRVTAVYYDILIWGAPLALGNYVMLGWLMGRSLIAAALLMQIGGNALNMLLDVLLVLVLDAGPAGVAAATLLAQFFSFLVGAAAVCRALPGGLHGMARLVDTGEMLRMARVNGHLFLRTVCLLTQVNIFMATAAGFGTVTLSGNAVLIQIMLIFSYVFEGIANASSVFAGKAVGRNTPGLMEETRRATRLWTLLAMLLLTGGYALWREPLLRLFTDLPEVLTEAGRYSLWGLLFPAAAGFGLSYYGMFTGASRTRPVFVSTLLALCAFAAVWAVAVPLWGNHGLWLAYMVFYAGRSLFLASLHPLPRNAQRARHTKSFFWGEGKPLC